jgi:hypothetical protein
VFVRRSSGRWRCRACEVDAVAARRHRRRAELVQRHGGCCERCGYDDWYGVLQFHHREPEEKLFTLGLASMGRSWASLCEEAAKCELLCANCHATHEAAAAITAAERIAARDHPEDRWCDRHGWRVRLVGATPTARSAA